MFEELLELIMKLIDIWLLFGVILTVTSLGAFRYDADVVNTTEKEAITSVNV